MATRTLIINDEPRLNRFFVRILARSQTGPDAKIDTAEDGPAGIALMQAHEDYDLIITDNIMPNTDFTALMQCIMSYPGRPAIVVNGGALNVAPPAQDPRIVLLPLPATPAEIRGAVSQARALCDSP